MLKLKIDNCVYVTNLCPNPGFREHYESFVAVGCTALPNYSFDIFRKTVFQFY